MAIVAGLPMTAGLEGVAAVTAEDDTRRELARELHDSIARSLAVMLLDLENFKAEQSGRESVLEMVRLLQESARSALADLRRVLFQLRGTGREMNLVAAVRALTRSTSQRSGLTVRTKVAASWPQAISTAAGMHLFRIVEEALTNTVLHGHATSARVVFGLAGDRATLSISDNGRGVPTPDGEIRRGVGLVGITERVALIGGELTLISRPGRGLTVRLSIPLAALLNSVATTTGGI